MPRLIEINGSLAVLTGRSADSFEYQMLHGIRLASEGSSALASHLLADTWLCRRPCGQRSQLLQTPA
jgi:hypothetical protein